MLAIGIVVDDAIVVVENVERYIEEGLSPLEAARRSMDEVSGALIAIVLVLCAVFVPTLFISGMSGAVLQTVRGYHFHRDGDFAVALAHPVSGTGRDPAARTRTPARDRTALETRGAIRR